MQRRLLELAEFGLQMQLGYCLGLEAARQTVSALGQQPGLLIAAMGLLVGHKLQQLMMAQLRWQGIGLPAEVELLTCPAWPVQALALGLVLWQPCCWPGAAERAQLMEDTWEQLPG